jgi:LPXTG-motif cell wall-anchored protein
MELKAILAIGLCLFILGGAVFLFIRKRKQK